MSELFSALTKAVEGEPLVAIGAALLWGILSVVLSPCHLASIPLIVGFVGSQERTSTGRAFLTSTLFASGILVTIAAVGGITAAAGRMLGDIGHYGRYVMAAMLFVMGLSLLGVIPMPWSGSVGTRYRKKGWLAAFVLGLIFGVAIGPCTFAFMAPMLGVTLGVAGARPAYGVGLLLVYGIGHSLVIILAGTFTRVVQRYLNWTERSRGAVTLRRACGILVILGGVYLLYAAH
jgi:cytochrome c-type biogenesis protein